MSCQHLAFRASDGEVEFGHPRPYCRVAERFVQPMRADICSERFELTPAGHCEIYRHHEAMDG